MAVVGFGVGVTCGDADCRGPAVDDVELLHPARQAVPPMIATVVAAPQKRRFQRWLGIRHSVAQETGQGESPGFGGDFRP
jgi:hypothetical protein